MSKLRGKGGRFKSKEQEVFVGLCGEFTGHRPFINTAYYRESDHEEDRMGKLNPSGCCVVSTSLDQIQEHMSRHGGCDCIILKGRIKQTDGNLTLEADMASYKYWIEKQEQLRLVSIQNHEAEIKKREAEIEQEKAKILALQGTRKPSI